MIASRGAHLGAQISALLDGQLAGDRADRAWRHIAECDVCRTAVQREEWVKLRLSGLAACEPPAGPPLRLRAALASLPAGPTVFAGWPEPARRGRGSRWAAAAVGVGTLSAAFVVLGAGYLAEDTRGTPEPATPTGFLPGGAWVTGPASDVAVTAPTPAAHRLRHHWARMEP